jgi:hypothetical protein
MRKTPYKEGLKRLIVLTLNGQTGQVRPRQPFTPRARLRGSTGSDRNPLACDFEVSDVVTCEVRVTRPSKLNTSY